MQCSYGLDLPVHRCELHTVVSSEFPEHNLPCPTGDGLEHDLCLFFSPPLHELEQVVQGDQDDQPPFTTKINITVK